VIDTIPIPKPNPDITGRKVKIKRGEYADRQGVVKEYKSSQWQVEIDLGNKKTVIEGYMIEELMILEDEASGIASQPNHVGSLTSAGVAVELAKSTWRDTPERIQLIVDLEGIGKKGDVLTTVPPPFSVSDEDEARYVEMYGGRLRVPVGTFSTVIDRSTPTTPEPLSELEQLRQEVQRLTNQVTAMEVAAKKADDLYRDLQAAQQARDSHLAANVKLNQEKLLLENKVGAYQISVDRLETQLEEVKKHRNTDIEALKLVERERDEAREELKTVNHDLRVANEQAAIFARELNKLRRAAKRQQQPIAIKTLIQMLSTDTDEDDQELALHLNTGWRVMNITVNTYFGTDVTSHRRVITLSRPVKQSAPDPERKAAVAETVPVTMPMISTHVIPVSTPVVQNAPFNVDSTIITAEGERPLTYSEALQLREAGLMSSDDLSAIGDREAGTNGLRAVLNRRRNAPQPYRPSFLPTGN
jgi:hypothetical protein